MTVSSFDFFVRFHRMHDEVFARTLSVSFVRSLVLFILKNLFGLQSDWDVFDRFFFLAAKHGRLIELN